MSKIGFVSLGCSKNLVDTEIMVGILKKRGHMIVTDERCADTIIINTCGFIDSAKEEAIATILEMAEYKKTNLKKLIVTGCLAQRYKAEVLKEMPEVDCIVGTARFTDIATAVEEDTEKIMISGGNAPYPEAEPRIISTPGYTAYLKIAEGCDNKCTYCAIPSIRGPLRSRKIEDIAREAAQLAGAGVAELNIIAQDTTRYGTDIYGEPRLLALLKRLANIEKLKWIRVLYTYPELLSDNLLDFIGKNEKTANYFDIPLQHISNPVLKKMGRKSTEDGIKSLIEKIKTKIPHAVIRTTFIVGFPGESNTDFKKLCSFAEWAEFDKMGAFKYSPEEGTPAAKLAGQIHEDVKDYRYHTLMELQRQISRKKCSRKIGRVYTCLVEGKNDKYFYGRTMQDAPEIDGVVYFKGRDVKTGSFVPVKITKAREYDLIGEMVNESSE